MTKKQKIWLGVFLGMFVIPEVLWSPVGNDIYARMMPLRDGSVQFFRNNFLTNVDNISISSTVLFIQFLGLFLSLAYLIILRKQLQNKMLLWVCVAVLLLLALTTFFVFGLSVSLRNIGF